jgi:hypothetical protein
MIAGKHLCSRGLAQELDESQVHSRVSSALFAICTGIGRAFDMQPNALLHKLLRILTVRVSASITTVRYKPCPQTTRRLKTWHNYHKIEMFPGSSMVEHSAVNRRVASSNLARGAKFLLSKASEISNIFPLPLNHFPPRETQRRRISSDANWLRGS